MHCLSAVYWVITPLHISGVSAAHHQEVECIYVANGASHTSETGRTRKCQRDVWFTRKSLKITVFWHVWPGRESHNLGQTYFSTPIPGTARSSETYVDLYKTTRYYLHLIPRLRMSGNLLLFPLYAFTPTAVCHGNRQSSLKYSSAAG
jgi:hypothetical protein